jgi:hypothetical protein
LSATQESSMVRRRRQEQVFNTIGQTASVRPRHAALAAERPQRDGMVPFVSSMGTSK